MSLVISGLITMVMGTFLVDYAGVTPECSSELTTKAVEYAPLFIGACMAWFGRVRLGDVNIFGVRK